MNKERKFTNKGLQEAQKILAQNNIPKKDLAIPGCSQSIIYKFFRRENITSRAYERLKVSWDQKLPEPFLDEWAEISQN